jgi:tetratricopeptide (TPR) repeat protein
MKSLTDMLDQMGQTDDAAEFGLLRETLEPQILTSHDPILLWRLGQIYRYREIWPDAERILHEAIKWGPSMADAYRDLGLLYIQRDDLPSEMSLQLAKDILMRGVRADRISNELSPVTHTLLGRVLEALNDPEGAESELRQALSIDPHYEEARYNLAMLLDDARSEEKLTLLRQSIAEDPNYFLALRDLGFELVKTKQLDEAENLLTQALSLDPADVLLRWYLAQLKWTQKDPSSAELHFKKAIELDPGNGESHRLLGRFYQHHGRVEEANRELFSAIELDPDNDDSFSAYLKFLDELEDRELAAKAFSAARWNTTLPKHRILELESKLFAG